MLTCSTDIRFDPGVESVTHNMALSPKLHWYEDGTIDEEPELSPLRKRWTMLNVKLGWWARMAVKWDMQDSIKNGERAKAVCVYALFLSFTTYHIDTTVGHIARQRQRC